MSRGSRVSWNEILKKSVPSTVAASALLMMLADDCSAQSGRKWFGSRPAPVAQPVVPQNGFAATVERLLAEARRQAAEGHVDEAIKTAQRARKIAEASAAVIRDNPNVSTTAADALLRDLLALQQATAPPAIIAAPRVEQVKPVELRPAIELPPSIEPPVVTAVVERPAPVAEIATTVKPPEAPVREIPVTDPLDGMDVEVKPTPGPTLAERRVLASGRSQNELRFGDLSSSLRIYDAVPSAKMGPAPSVEALDVALPQTPVALGEPAPIVPALAAAPAPASSVIADPAVAVREPQRAGWETAVELSSEPVEIEYPTVMLGPPQAFPPSVPVKPLAAAHAVAEPERTDVVEHSVMVWANRTGSVAVSEPTANLLSSATKDVELATIVLESAAIPLGSEPRLGEDTDWSSAEPSSARRRSSAALLDTAWEADGGPSGANDERAEPAVFGPSASAPTATSNTPVVAVVIEPLMESDVVTPAGFTPSIPPVAPPPPSELDAVAAAAPAVAFESGESGSGPAVWTRESISPPPHPPITASFVDQLAARWRLPAQTLVAGFAAAGLLLLGLGVGLLRVATQPGRR